jgi:hypothetical protein
MRVTNAGNGVRRRWSVRRHKRLLIYEVRSRPEQAFPHYQPATSYADDVIGIEPL